MRLWYLLMSASMNASSPQEVPELATNMSRRPPNSLTTVSTAASTSSYDVTSTLYALPIQLWVSQGTRGIDVEGKRVCIELGIVTFDIEGFLNASSLLDSLAI